jgi:hypothetical protein
MNPPTPERIAEIRAVLDDTVSSLRPGEQLDSADGAITELLAHIDAQASATADLRRELEEANERITGCADHAVKRNAEIDGATLAYANDVTRLTATVSEVTAERNSLRLDVAALRGALLRTTGSLGLIVKGASPNAVGHIENYETGKAVLTATTRPDHAVVGRGELEALRESVQRLEAVRLAALREIAYDAAPASEKYVTGTIQRAHRILSTGEPDGILKTAAIDSAATAKGRTL